MSYFIFYDNNCVFNCCWTSFFAKKTEEIEFEIVHSHCLVSCSRYCKNDSYVKHLIQSVAKKQKTKQLSVFPNKFIWVCKFANIALQLNIWVTYFRGFKSLQFILLFYIIYVKSTLPELFTSYCTLDHTKIRQHHRLAFHGPKQKTSIIII